MTSIVFDWLRIGRAWFGDGLKIMFAFGRAVRDKEAIFDTRLEWLRARARYFGFHAGNTLAVNEWPLDWSGICVGNQMPERQAMIIGLPFVQRDDFEFREFIWPA